MSIYNKTLSQHNTNLKKRRTYHMSNFLGSSFFGQAMESFNGPEVPAFEGHVNLQEASLEATAVIEGAYSSLFVAEAAANRQVSMGQMALESVQGTLEAAGGGVIARIKQAFKRLLEKIKGWMANIRKSFDILTKKGAEFVSKFKSEIESKSPAGFKYSGYDWTLSEGDGTADRATGAIAGLITSIVSHASDKSKQSAAAGANAQSAADGVAKGANAETISNALSTRKSEILKKVGSEVSELAGVSKVIEKAFRSGEKKEIVAFGSINRVAMMDYIKDNSKKIEGIAKNNAKQEKAIQEVIAALGKAESEYMKATASGGTSATVTGVMAQMSKDAQFAVNVISSITATQKAMHTAANSEFEGALKSFLRFKGNKASATTESTTATDVDVDPITSVIESTINGFTS